MPYRTDGPALEERRARIWRELEEAKRSRASLEAIAAREKSLEAELRAVDVKLADASRSVLDSIKIASPCKASWDDMVGDDRVRFCGKCAKNVYDLSAMDRAEAEALIAKNEGSMCVRLSRRSDGTVISNDCPVGLRKKRVRLAVFGAAGAGALACAAMVQATTTTVGGIRPQRVMMGEMAPIEQMKEPPPRDEHEPRTVK